MKQHILIAILAIFTAFSLRAQVINNPSGNTSNNLYSTSICYVSAAPTWNPDVSAASKWCKIAYNETTGEIWYWQAAKIANGNGAWVSASIITRMASNTPPSHTPPNPAEIVILPNGTLYTWNGSAWAASSGGGSTNLTATTAASTVTVNSDTGTDAIIPAATTSQAGVMTATDKTNLNSVVANSHVPVTVTDGSKIDFTLTGQNITATILPASIDGADIADNAIGTDQIQDGSVLPDDLVGDPLGNIGDVLTVGASGVPEWAAPGSGITIGPTASRPAATTDGNLYYNTTSDQLNIADGIEWLRAGNWDYYGVVRFVPADSSWQLLDDLDHTPYHITSITSTKTGNGFTVNLPAGLNRKVGTCTIIPDETLVRAGITAGPSVGLTNVFVTLTQSGFSVRLNGSNVIINSAEIITGTTGAIVADENIGG